MSPWAPGPAPRVRRLGDEPDLGHLTSRGPRQAHLDGFDLHANVWVPHTNRARLEQLCRYLLRPPLAQDRLRLRPDGRVLVALKTVWRDGTSHFLFEPIEFLEKLAALIPRPAVHLLLYHGVLASRARRRSQVVRYGRLAPDAALTREVRPAVSTHAWTWAALMRRALALDVLACPRGGGRRRSTTPLRWSPARVLEGDGMTCPRCQQENPTAAHFCMRCGAGLTLTCANCNMTLPTGTTVA